MHSAICKSITFQCFIFRAAQCKGRLVTAHCWDVEDPRLLVCRAQRMESHDFKSFKKDNNQVMSIKLQLDLGLNIYTLENARVRRRMLDGITKILGSNFFRIGFTELKAVTHFKVYE